MMVSRTFTEEHVEHLKVLRWWCCDLDISTGSCSIQGLRGPMHWESFSTDWFSFANNSSIHVMFSWHPLHSDLSVRLPICKTQLSFSQPICTVCLRQDHFSSAAPHCSVYTKETWGCSFTAETTVKAWTVSNWHLYKSSELLGSLV